MMLKKKIADGITRYQFPPHEGKHFGFNLYALLDDAAGQALLIDTGYQEHAAAVLGDLTQQGYALTTVVISHFHPDHILGLRALPPVEIVGSPRYGETLREYGPREEWSPFVPTCTPGEGGRIDFGRFILQFQLAPGHAPCSQYTLISEEFIHVADNIMTSNTGQDILPWAEFSLVSDHIASLELLREHARRTLLPSHGVEISDASTAIAAIENRIRYFQAILDGDARIPFDQATAGCSCAFLHPEWLIRNTD
jgi:glyoxylase-like metal-dependent hydrolase (beta-lactamase superfamily II)